MRSILLFVSVLSVGLMPEAQAASDGGFTTGGLIGTQLEAGDVNLEHTDVGPTFDGERATTELVASLSTYPPVHWQVCTDTSGNEVDDCLVITEQETMETLVTRKVIAETCGLRDRDCYGGYAIVEESAVTFDGSEAYGSTGFTLYLSGATKVRAENALGGSSLVASGGFDGEMTIARGYQDVSFWFFDAEGDFVDDYVFQMNAGSSGDGDVDCTELGADAEVVAKEVLRIASEAAVPWGTVTGTSVGFIAGAFGGFGFGAGPGAMTGLAIGNAFGTVVEGGIDIAAPYVEDAVGMVAQYICEEVNAEEPTVDPDIEPGDDTERETMEETEGRCADGEVWSPVETSHEYDMCTIEDGELTVTDGTYTTIEWMCLPL
jgi:hypothetical protein